MTHLQVTYLGTYLSDPTCPVKVGSLQQALIRFHWPDRALVPPRTLTLRRPPRSPLAAHGGETVHL